MYNKQFFLAGINYKKTDATIRGKFAVNQEQYAHLLQQAKESGIDELFVLSTCNRTEIYGLAHSINDLVKLLCSHTTESEALFHELCYIKKGSEAVEHLFNVAAGLDSQILGDYEIVGQIKQSIKFSKERGCIGTFLERLFNIVLQSSKVIKNKTAISGGTVSVSFAAIQYLKETIADIRNKHIAVIGTGKIGRNTCKNLVDYLDNKNITLINRTFDKAKELADELKIKAVLYEQMLSYVNTADIIIVAANAEEPVIQKKHLINSSNKILIDLSIPNNIEPSVGELPGITLVNVDDLSKINDETLQKRQAEVPKAKAIIQEHIREFSEWYTMRKNVPVIKAVKQKLIDIQQDSAFLPDHYADEIIQKIVNNMAAKMRQQANPGCNYIEALNDYMQNAVSNER